MEERVYLCGWKKGPGIFSLWLSEPPYSKADGQNLSEAIENLISSVQDDDGAVVPNFEFAPPLPKNQFESVFNSPELFLISGDECFEPDRVRAPAFSAPELREAEERWYEQFFDGTSCRECRTPSKSRNDKLLPLAYSGNGEDGGFMPLGNGLISFFSEEFLTLLSEEELQRIHFKPTQQLGEIKKVVFELVGSPEIAPVAVCGIAANGWRCNACGHRQFVTYSKRLSYRQFIAKADLPEPLPSLFIIGSPWNLGLCITAERWKEFVGRKGTRGLLSRPLGVVPDKLVVRSPVVKPRQRE